MVSSGETKRSKWGGSGLCESLPPLYFKRKNKGRKTKAIKGEKILDLPSKKIYNKAHADIVHR